MSLTPTPIRLLVRELEKTYIGKTIISDGGTPFTVGRVNWCEAVSEVTFHEAAYPSTCLSPRSVGLKDTLPEIWPFEPPMSPCS